MLKNFALILSALTALIGLAGCNQDGPLLSVLGLDRDGNEMEMKVSESKFREQFTNILNSASVSSLQTAQEQENGSGQWALNEIEVGIDLELKGGITTIVTLGTGSGASLTLNRENQKAGAKHE